MSEQIIKEEELLPIVSDAIERFYSWLNLIDVKEKETVENVNNYNVEKVNLLHESGHKVSNEILDLFCETLLMHFHFVKKSEKLLLN